MHALFMKGGACGVCTPDLEAGRGSRSCRAGTGRGGLGAGHAGAGPASKCLIAGSFAGTVAMGHDERKKRSQTITFRLDPDLIKEIKNDAELERINVNALVSKILSNHVLWERYERKMGLLPMTKPFVQHSINRMSDDEIVHLAEEVEKDTFSDILNFMKEGRPDMEGQVVVVHDVRPDVGDARQIRHGRGLKDSLGVVTSYP